MLALFLFHFKFFEQREFQYLIEESFQKTGDMPFNSIHVNNKYLFSSGIYTLFSGYRRQETEKGRLATQVQGAGGCALVPCTPIFPGPL